MDIFIIDTAIMTNRIVYIALNIRSAIGGAIHR